MVIKFKIIFYKWYHLPGIYNPHLLKIHLKNIRDIFNINLFFIIIINFLLFSIYTTPYTNIFFIYLLIKFILIFHSCHTQKYIYNRVFLYFILHTSNKIYLKLFLSDQLWHSYFSEKFFSEKFLKILPGKYLKNFHFFK